jgi:uncharacterized protein YgiM (DUF1202 family)
MNHRKMLSLPGCRTAVGLALLTVLVGVNFSSKSFSAEWRTIRKEELPITFYGPGLRNSNTRFSSTENLYLTSWVSKSGSVPRAEFAYQTTKPAYSFTQENDLEDRTVVWNWIKKKSPTLSETDTIWNGYGKTTYLTFSVDGNSCIALQRYTGQNKNFGLGTIYLTGYYCGNSSQRIDKHRAEELISAISVDGERDATAPDGYWSEPTSTSNTVTEAKSKNATNTTSRWKDTGDNLVCTQALKSERSGVVAWETSRYQGQVREARKRGFTPESCTQLLGRKVQVAVPSNDPGTTIHNLPKFTLCSIATKSNGQWAAWNPAVPDYLAEARRRNISLRDCAHLTKKRYKSTNQAAAEDEERRKKAKIKADIIAKAMAEKKRKAKEDRKRIGEEAERQKRLVAERKLALENEKRKLLEPLRKKHKDSIAVIIGNKKYSGDVPPVDFAHNDADAIRKFVVERLGFRDGNIIDLRDATRNQIANVFGDNKNPEGQLFDWVKPKKSDVFVYYSGHGVPGLKDQRPYILPTDGNANRAEITGYPLDVLYKNLSQLPARSIRVFIDACFSGDSAKGKLIKGVSGLVITPTMPKASSWMTVVTAAQNNQFASWDEKSKHGMFTKYLLDALDGEADKVEFGNSDGKVTLGEVQKYLDSEMSYQVRRTWGRKQDASFSGDNSTVLASVTAVPKNVVKPFSIEEMDANYVAIRTANLRLAPSTSSRVVGSLRRGKKVYVTGRVSGKNWYRLYDGSFVFGTLVEPVDLNHWNSIKDSDDVAKFKGYLAIFPNGQFADVAKRLIEALKPKTQTASIAIVPRSNTPSSGKYKPGDTFKDCDTCPEMVVIPKGSFQMGDLNGGGFANEKPVHRVNINYSFAVGKFEVTQAQWRSVMGSNPSHFKGGPVPV